VNKISPGACEKRRAQGESDLKSLFDLGNLIGNQPIRNERSFLIEHSLLVPMDVFRIAVRR